GKVLHGYLSQELQNAWECSLPAFNPGSATKTPPATSAATWFSLNYQQVGAKVAAVAAKRPLLKKGLFKLR
ncbi:MAG TPA: hypothetical protein VI685_10215, partial [Candidatus Angelobacter sp.]